MNTHPPRIYCMPTPSSVEVMILYVAARCCWDLTVNWDIKSVSSSMVAAAVIASVDGL